MASRITKPRKRITIPMIDGSVVSMATLAKKYPKRDDKPTSQDDWNLAPTPKEKQLAAMKAEQRRDALKVETINSARDKRVRPEELANKPWLLARRINSISGTHRATITRRKVDEKGKPRKD